ncbi:SGNH/GDSL hydrolase family protein [Pseudomonas glycinae]|uniref:SGNH/GDSL hydrolase family protein n=1 Tax=Pseudomonas TaxID=286 RepID=UPI0009ED706B|nr:SGNH/GDSL hydrolase family protein [Pseudomonas sp. DR 5-09]
MNSVLVLGDSHALVFSSEQMRGLFPEHSFEVISVGGATVSGLKNPNAVTQAMPQYLAALQATTANTVIVMLGEVDTGFVIWYRAQKHGSSVEQMLAQAVGNYQNLLRDIAKKFQVICISTPLPTIRDDMQWGDVANLRKEVTASLSQRTQLTKEFNSLMENFCLKTGISHLNFDELSTDELGQLKETLRNPDPNDHHYDQTAHAKMIEPLLKPVLLHSKTDKQLAAEPETAIAPPAENTSLIGNLVRIFLRRK